MPGAPLRPSLAGLKAYQPEPPEGDAALDANESPFAPPPEFLQRAAQAVAVLPYNRYPDPACSGLRSRLASLHGVPQDSLLFGNGSDELIPLLLAAFGGGEALCLVPRPSFSMYKLCALGLGWRVEELGLDPALGWDLSPAFVDRARALKPRLIFLASPNNPTGKALDPGLVGALAALPDCTLVLDEAYAEFGGQSRLAQALGQAGLVVLRTFSKAWGLAGLRLGWLCAQPALVAQLEKLRLPYNIDGLSQALGEAALDLAPQFQARVPQLLALKARLRAILEALPGAQLQPSDANFHLLRHPAAIALHRALLAAGLRVRRFEGGVLDGHLRISVGDAAQLDRLEAVCKAFAAQEAR
jgi:histidinol-phosphate aminotransferase